MEEIARGVFVETAVPGCNAGYVVTPEGIVLIDTPEPPSVAVRWRDTLKRQGPVLYIVNTEHHIDHILGNPFFEGRVVAHEGTRASFWEVSPVTGASIREAREFVAKSDPQGLPFMEGYLPKEPSLTFSERLTLHVGGEEIELVNLPGHVPNTTIVHLPRHRIGFTSDLIFHNLMPWLHQCLPHHWLKALDVLEAMDVALLVPGHGKLCDKSYIPIMRGFLIEVFHTVREAIQRGMTREEAAERITFIDRCPIPPEYVKIAPIVQRRNIERVYDQLKEEGSAAPRG